VIQRLRHPALIAERLNDIEDGLSSVELELGIHLILSLLLRVRETFRPLRYPPRTYIDQILLDSGG
jgi:hypothetical protein